MGVHQQFESGCTDDEYWKGGIIRSTRQKPRLSRFSWLKRPEDTDVQILNVSIRKNCFAILDIASKAVFFVPGLRLQAKDGGSIPALI